jgi:2-haloacid dehalogenase
MKPRAVVFDAYGTLFDVHSAVLRDGHGITGDLRALSELCRQRQLNTLGCDRSWSDTRISEF